MQKSIPQLVEMIQIRLFIQTRVGSFEGKHWVRPSEIVVRLELHHNEDILYRGLAPVFVNYEVDGNDINASLVSIRPANQERLDEVELVYQVGLASNGYPSDGPGDKVRPFN